MKLPRCPACHSEAIVRTNGPFTVVVCQKPTCENEHAVINTNREKALVLFSNNQRSEPK